MELWPAHEGDCILVKYGTDVEQRILVDTGRASTGMAVGEALYPFRGDMTELSLLVVTHIDRDHIEGALPLLAAGKGKGIGEVWFNAYQHLGGRGVERGALQAERLSGEICSLGIPWNTSFRGNAVAIRNGSKLPVVKLKGGLRLTVLAPDEAALRRLAPRWRRECTRAGITAGNIGARRKSAARLVQHVTDVEGLAALPFFPDASVPNGSSIALLAQFRGRTILLGGDAHEHRLLESIRALRAGGPRLRIDFFKVPHHGSAGNISRALLQEIDCENYAISTDGSLHGLPDAAAIARIIKWSCRPARLYFNYRSSFTAPWASRKLQERFNYSAKFGKSGHLAISLP